MRAIAFGMLVTTMFAVNGGLIGQDKGSPKDEPKAKGQLPQGWGKANLGLTEEQRQKVLALDSKYDGEIEVLTKKVADLKKKKTEDQVAVLTAEQKKKLEDYFKSKAGTGK